MKCAVLVTFGLPPANVVFGCPEIVLGIILAAHDCLIILSLSVTTMYRVDRYYFKTYCFRTNDNGRIRRQNNVLVACNLSPTVEETKRSEHKFLASRRSDYVQRSKN